MVKVNYVPPADVRARLLALKPFRDELCQLAAHYRFSSPEYRRLAEAKAALDEVAAALVGERTLLHIQLEPSRWTGKPD